MDLAIEKYSEDLRNFTPPTDRVRNLKERVLNAVPELCIERGRIITKADKEFGSLPPSLKRAKILAEILKNMSIFIDSEELIVGNQARKLRAAPIFPEYSVEWIAEELDSFETRPADKFKVYEEEKEEIMQIVDYWRGRTHEDRLKALMPEDVRQAEDMGVLMGIHIRIGGHGHISVSHEKVLKRGLLDIANEAEMEIEKLELISADDVNKLSFLKGVVIVCNAVIDFAHRYADIALEMAEQESDLLRKKELEKISEVCRWVPAKPPRNFYEAIQTSWFIQLVLQIESNGHSISMGRFDQNLYPFYKADVEEGRIDAKKAQELIACFFIKLKTINKVRAWDHAKYATGYPMYQNMTIGGQHPNGRDAVNAVTYLCINAMENVRFPEPNLIARYWSGASDDYLKKCINSISLGFGMPAMINDEVIIPSLLSRGVSRLDAFNYGAVGCVEVSVPGKWGYRCYGMTFTNFIRLFELTIRGGKDPKFENNFLESGKGLQECETFEELMLEWKRENEIFAKIAVKHDIIVDECKKEIPEVFFSALVDDCIKRGKTILEGGAVYDMNSGVQIGLANVANSLATIKKLVFEEKKFTGSEVLKALDENFEGENGEVIRQMFKNTVPKYGNDDDYVDEIAVEAYETYMDIIEKFKNARDGRGPVGCGYYPSTVTVSANVPAGQSVGATPDGRKAGEPVAEGASPHSGTDLNGPTSVMKSVTKLPTIRMTGGQLLNLKFSSNLLKNEEEKWKLVQLLRGFSDLRGWHVQFNTVSRDILRNAQKNPEDYKNLMVRVAGYCALFTDLDTDVQNEIIKRTEHTQM